LTELENNIIVAQNLLQVSWFIDKKGRMLQMEKGSALQSYPLKHSLQGRRMMSILDRIPL